MSTNSYLHALVLIALTAGAARVSAQTIAHSFVPTSPAARAEALHNGGVALHANLTRAAEAARLHVESARMRQSDDPQAVNCLTLAAHLFSYSNRPMQARKTMEQAAERALAMGNVALAGRAYVEA